MTKYIKQVHGSHPKQRTGVGYHLESRTLKDHPSTKWFHLNQWFLWRFKCDFFLYQNEPNLHNQ